LVGIDIAIQWLLCCCEGADVLAVVLVVWLPLGGVMFGVAAAWLLGAGATPLAPEEPDSVRVLPVGMPVSIPAAPIVPAPLLVAGGAAMVPELPDCVSGEAVVLPAGDVALCAEAMPTDTIRAAEASKMERIGNLL
jgi:hypothetical protein